MNLPPLREELLLTEGPRGHDGQPNWTLQDPACNRFYRLDWLTFEILQRWTLNEPALIARVIGDQTPLKPDAADVESVIGFLGTNQLLKFAGAPNSAALARHHAAGRQEGWRWLLHNYLFFRVPLLRPDRLLTWLEDRLHFLFSAWFWQTTCLAGLAGLFLASRQWDQFSSTWTDLANLNGLLGYAFLLAGVKIVHEFGHGLAAKHFGCRVPTMGVAFLVLTPVAYTDTNESWKLQERRPRLIIGAAGMIAELALAAWATLAWALLPDGYWRSLAFMLATITWLKSLLINTSPVMRFDGYYLLSDFLDLPNLHQRSFALARWKLREWLFALGEEPPENFRRSLQRGLIGFAFFVWLYRLIVFVGIAIFVYHYFFKALGIFLFAVEIAWFILLPVAAEMREWRERGRRLFRSRRPLGLAALALGAFLLTLVPIPQRVRLSGELRARDEFRIVTPEKARLVALPAADGALVEAGQPLLRLESPSLQFRRDQIAARVTSLEGMIAAARADPAMRNRAALLEANLAAARASVREAEVALAQLAPDAPSRGVLRLADCDLLAGEWIGKQEHVATLVGSGALKVIGYLSEQDVPIVTVGATARFYSEGAVEEVIDLRVREIERDAARTISHPMLSTVFGGSIPARIAEDNLVPEHGVYRITFEVVGPADSLSSQVRRGRIVIAAGAESTWARGFRAVASVLWREAGF